MAHPMGVDGPEQQEAFQDPHLIRAQFYFPQLIGLVGMVGQRLLNLPPAELVNQILVGE